VNVDCKIFLFAMLVVAGSHAYADDDESDPSVVPYRPTVSNPADLSAPGWIEGEFGGLHTRNEDRSIDDTVPWLLKYAFDENHGLMIGGNAYAGMRAPGMPSQSGFGDTSLEYKQRFSVNESTAFGIETGVIAPTASQGGLGKSQWLANGIFSTDVGALHMDLNLGEAHGGAQPAHVSQWQTMWAAAVSTQLVGAFGAAFEVSGTYQAGSATQSQALVAFNYNVSHRVVLDAGAAYGLAHDAHDKSLFAGATVLLGRVRQ
jgi:hypothetical protein